VRTRASNYNALSSPTWVFASNNSPSVAPVSPLQVRLSAPLSMAITTFGGTRRRDSRNVAVGGISESIHAGDNRMKVRCSYAMNETVVRCSYCVLGDELRPMVPIRRPLVRLQ
jgi:hypothetical protein